MNFRDMKLLYMASCGVLIFIVWAPIVFSAVPLPESERFSELWLLGENRMIDSYPFDVVVGRVNKLYLGVQNRLGASSYYVVYAKFRNQAEPLPNRTSGSPSPLEPVLEYRLFLGDNEKWEREVSFSVDDALFQENMCRVSRILLDGNFVEVDKVAERDEEDGGFYYELFFELWVYNETISDIQFHERFVGSWLRLSR